MSWIILRRRLAGAARMTTIRPHAHGPASLGRSHRLHTLMHRRAHHHMSRSTASVDASNSSTASHLLRRGPQQPLGVRGISYSFIPRLLIKTVGRLPIFVVGGTAVGGAYTIAKVDAARRSVNDSLSEAWDSIDKALNTAGEAVSRASTSFGQGADEVKGFSKGVWMSLRSFAGTLFDGGEMPQGSERDDSSTGSDGGSGRPSPKQTPDRIAAVAAMASTLPLFVPSPDDDLDPSDQATNDLMVLTKKLIEIRSILLTIDQKESLQLPAIVVIGSQSSGKSSVLEAVVGREFLPKGNNMVTRRPIELTLIHTPPTPADPRPKTFAELPSYAPGQIYTDFEQVQTMLASLNTSIPAGQAVSAVPIELRIHSPNVPDLSLVDLPGYIELSSMDQPDTLKEEIANLCEKYIKPPNVILAVCAADVDLANSPALRASRRVDPLGMRTIGVVTKMDLVEPRHGVEILTNKRYPLALGYVGVVCKAAAKSREGKSIVKVRNAEDEGLSVPVRKQEQAYFGQHREEFSREGVQVTTDLLKKRLMHVLEESMASSLHGISSNVALELEEARYQFKVQYNDRTVSPESYLAESLDSIKHRLNHFSKSYGKAKVRQLLKGYLDDKAMNLLAEIYWSDPSERGNMDNLARVAVSVESGAYKLSHSRDPEAVKAQADALALWEQKLERATSMLTKSGVGKASTELVVDVLRAHIQNHLTKEPPLVHHPSASERINAFSDALLRDRFTITADQVENSIKPLKFEVELDAEGKEWEKGRLGSIDMLHREIEMCENALKAINESVGGQRRLKGAMQYVSDLEERERQRAAARRAAIARQSDPNYVSSPELDDDLLKEDVQDPTRPIFNPALLVKAREAHLLTGRTALLKARMAALKSRQCRNFSPKNEERIRTYCPEAFLNIVADKLANTAVSFINIELLAEYFYLFPRQIETSLHYDLSRQEILEFARENPRFRQHIDLQERKEKLELVKEKLDALIRMQQERLGANSRYGGHGGEAGSRRSGTASSSSSSSSGRRFGLF